MKLPRNPDAIHKPLAGYSHQLEIKGLERLLVISGQVGQTLDGEIPDDPVDQLEVAFVNLKTNLEAANMDVCDLVKVTFYLVGEFDTERRREVTKKFFGDCKPCMTLLYVQALTSPAFKVEIDAWASIDN